MKKIFTCFFLLLIYFCNLNAQTDVQFRVILIGDAGEDNAVQHAIITDAIARAIPGKTMAIFLGDNVYPKGVALSGSKKQVSFAVLRSQFEQLRKNNIPVYFVPGNHDWDKSGPQGYDKIIAANDFIDGQQDSLLQVIPAGGCPGPYELPVSDNLVIVAMDSEWWLYPFDKQTDKSDCPCKTKRDVLGKLNDIIARNRNKTIIFATHHPFDSYGSHGGYYSFREHLFPLTDLNKNLYIPLPIIGSLYPLLRKTFPPAEDIKNTLYQDMKKGVDEILRQHPNIIHAAGHEHTLQLIQGAVLQVVSGAGSKHTPVKKGHGSLYAADSSGYVLADLMKDNSLRLNYFTYDDKEIRASFIYNRPFTSVAPLAVFKQENNITADSMRVRMNGSFDSVSNTHRKLFGNNYRSVWGIETNIKVLHLSTAGFTPLERGGGMQTHSLRLSGRDDEEWVLRSIDKFPDALLPAVLNQTLAAKLLHDNVSAIFPYAPLAVPVIANALGVAHSNPAVVYVAPDKNLGIYSKDFANTVDLLEEREPLGKSASTIKMQEKLKEDNDNAVNQQAFLTARLQDIFLGDWDRHGDQWRWVDEGKGKSKLYRPVPRDRDQVLYVNEGLLPALAALPWIQPKLQGYGNGHIRDINTFSFNARQLDGLYTNSLSYEDWMGITREVVTALTDSVIDAALRRMPVAVYEASHKKLFAQLKKRRDELMKAMPVYYRFLNKNVDILASDKNEQVIITDTLNGQLLLQMYKITKKNDTGKLLYSRLFDPAITKELNLYMYGGEDNINITNRSSPVTIRIIGDASAEKQYRFSGKPVFLRKVHVYDNDSATINGKIRHVRLHLRQDDDNTGLVLTNRYNKTIPLLTAGYNADDGLLLGAGVKWIRQGFRKQPYASAQQILFSHSFSTNAFRIAYEGEWLHLADKTDFTLQLHAFAPDNTQNFFGLGNNTPIDKTGNYKRFYRVRFDYYQLDPAFRWRNGKAASFSIGPSLEYYHYSPDENKGRFINNISELHSYDSSTIARDKSHIGLKTVYVHDNRNSSLLPSAGSFINLALKGYTGLNSYSKSYMQLSGQLAVYKSIGRKAAIVFADRIGGGVTAGKAAFYQSLFLGGEGNLLGYRQFRFAGQQMLYNNLEARIKLTNLASYILPGELGLVGFYDAGKVWQKEYNDAKWHQGIGGGLYFAPAQMMVVRLVAGYSPEGWYPYFTAGFRF